MSSNGDEINRREVAWRLFASEFRDADYSYAESDEERAPNYVVTPTGARVNRLFVVGVLTEVEYVSDDYLRARIVDPTGAFVVYAGQYQPEALTFLESAETPMFVAVTGKARTFQPEDSDVVYTSIRPESISEVDATTRDNWVVTTAEQTLERVATTADALDLVERGDDLQAVLAARHVPEGLAAGIPLAIDHYGTTEHYLAAVRDLALDAARVVAGEREEVRQHTFDPNDESDEPVSLGLDDLTLVTGDAQPVTTDDADTSAPEAEQESTDVDAEADAAAETAVETEPDTETAESPDAEAKSTDAEPESTADAAAPTVGSGGAAEAESDTGTESDAGTGSESETESDAGTGSESETESKTETGSETDTEPDTAAESADEADAQPAAEQEPADTDEMYELSEEERREVEENYDVGFTTADEVEGEAGIEPETPQPEEPEGEAPEAEEPEAEGTEAEEPEPEPTEESTDEAPSAGDDAETADEVDAADDGAVSADDLEDAVVETMQDLGDGDGADRDDLVATVMEAHGVDEDAVEDAIQAALMSGRCYESGENELTAI